MWRDVEKEAHHALVVAFPALIEIPEGTLGCFGPGEGIVDHCMHAA